MHLSKPIGIQHLLRYLNFTPDFRLCFSPTPPSSLQGFSDSDYLGCTTTRRLIGSYLFTLAGGPISWASKQQPTISDITTEAKYKALFEAAKEGVYLRVFSGTRILSFLKVPLSCPDPQIITDLQHASTPTLGDIHLACDNQGAVKLAKNPLFHAKTKHIEAKHHFICERVLAGEISLSYIHTDDNPADLQTKPLSRPKFEKHRDFIGVKSL